MSSEDKPSWQRADFWWLGLVYLASAGLFVWGLLQGQETFEWASKAAGLVVVGAGLYSVLLLRTQLIAQERQLRESHNQLADDHKWRTYVSYHEFFSEIPDADTSNQMYELAKKLNFIEHFNDDGHPMPDHAYRSILENCNQWQLVRPYLDAFEKFCGAINAGIVDEDYAFSLQATRVIRNYTVFERLIKHYQTGTGTAYIELQKVATKWSMKARVAEATRREQIGVGSGTTTRLAGPNE